MSAAIIKFPTTPDQPATPAMPVMVPPADATPEEQRMWWLGYAAGHQQRSNEYEAEETAMLGAAQQFLVSRGFAPVLQAVK